jgi:hypothetical protein
MIDGVKSLEFQIVGEKNSSPLELLFFIGDNHILYADRKQALACPSTSHGDPRPPVYWVSPFLV